MTSTGSATPDRYTHGHHASVVGQHARRTAERDAAFLLPHLRAGMRLLDVGCGPGTITTGLARAVAPGDVVGIELVDGVIEQAREHAAREGIDNARFEYGDVYALPYADASFDAAYAHQVLQHLARQADALAEMHRVLRPGGLVAVRDADYQTMLAWPRLPEIDRWLEVYHAVAWENGAEPDAGRRIPSWLTSAGFVDIEVTATPMLFRDRADVENWGFSWADRVTKSSLASQAIEYGFATREELDGIAEGWRRWARDPEALFLYVNVEGLARRP
jgi:ubiquinone/menaquinone biosynthesis C-methylase UbiE